MRDEERKILSDKQSRWLSSIATFGSHSWSVADLVRVRFRGDDFERLRSHLIRSDERGQPEYAAYVLAGTQEYEQDDESVFEYLVRDVKLLRRGEYLEQGSAIVRIGAETIRSQQFAAKSSITGVDDLAILMCHSHPRAMSPRFSGVDDSNEPAHMASLTGEENGPHGSLIFGKSGITGRCWSADIGEIRNQSIQDAATPIDQIVIHHERELQRIRTTDSRLPSMRLKQPDPMRERQALVHGDRGNQQLRAAHVAVVGAGGLGSLVIQGLAHLGIGRMTVVDPDVVEESNRSRIVGSEPDDAGDPTATPSEEGVISAKWSDEIEGCGTPKVDVAERLVASIDPEITYVGVPEEVQERSAFRTVVSADVIVITTDTAISRRFVSQGASQYMRPLFSSGAVVRASPERGVRSIATSFYLSGVGRPCLDCLGRINEDRIAAEGEDPEELEYGLELVSGEQPAVISLNMEPAQRVVYAVHRYLTGLFADRSTFRIGTYLPIEGRLLYEPDDKKGCIFCDGTLSGTGDRGVKIAKANLFRTRPSTLEQARSDATSTDDVGRQGQLEADESVGVLSRGIRWIKSLAFGQ